MFFFLAKIRYFFTHYGKTLCSFGAIQGMQIVMPLLALPWLARILGPDAFGLLMYMCLFPPLIALLVDWGITLGGTRKAAAIRGDHANLGNLLGAAMAGKLALGSICIIFCSGLLFVLPHCADHPLAFTFAVWAGLARGFNPAWFFQGAGYGIVHVAILDVSASICALGAVFLFIKMPEEWPLYLLFVAATKTVAYGWIYGELWRAYHFRLKIGEGKDILYQTATLFGSSFAQMVCYNGGQLVLGWFLSAPAMGIVVAVSKMLRALVSLINPFTQTLFPEICIWQNKEPSRARRALRISLLTTAVCSCLVAGVTAFLAPALIDIALGQAYTQAAPVLQLMLLAAPLMACDNVLAQQILIPYGQEKAQLVALACAAGLGLILAGLLGAAWGVTGGACLPAVTELATMAGYITAIHYKCKEALVK